MLKKLFVLSLILVLGFSFSSKEKSKIQSENIIVLVIDGPRYTETWGDSTHAHIPNMYSQLLPQGVLYQDFRNTGFTITNGGVFGSLMSTPILNYPQVAILGLHGIKDRPVVVDGEIVIRPWMYMALTYDHRIVDGSSAVQFLVKIKDSDFGARMMW